ncbi:C40 family peptidase [Neobacillus drentensis]|nr:C40 family peptidase [Neobacillus drentensis]
MTGTVKPVTAPAPVTQTDAAAQIVSIAKSLIGVPYVWGGSTASGFDCSGFIYYVANKAGKSLPRTSAAGYYDRTYYVNSPKAGDIVFFENTYKQGISHLGIYLNDNQFIHADEKHGIMISNLNSPYYTAHFAAFKRFY